MYLNKYQVRKNLETGTFDIVHRTQVAEGMIINERLVSSMSNREDALESARLLNSAHGIKEIDYDDIPDHIARNER